MSLALIRGNENGEARQFKEQLRELNIMPGLVICFTIDNIHAVLSKHPTLTFSQSPKVCSVHLCLFFCFAYRVIITIFLNSIYMCQYTVMGGMHEISARAQCTGKTQRNWVEREVGGGIGMGNTCNSMADSCQRVTKPTAML